MNKKILDDVLDRLTQAGLASYDKKNKVVTYIPSNHQ
jgi:hypothetical protein